MKKYKFIGTEEEAEQYGKPYPILGKTYYANVIVGEDKLSVARFVKMQEQWETLEWEEVIDPEVEKKEILDAVATKLPEKDNINPDHYKQGKVECIDALESATVNKSGIEAVCTANVIKYLWRYESKNGIEDVKKAKWYLEKLIKILNQIN